jgi:hypothetical protein
MLLLETGSTFTRLNKAQTSPLEFNVESVWVEFALEVARKAT